MSLNSLGSAFKTPKTSFQIVRLSASKQKAKIPAVKSDPSRPKVVVFPFKSPAINP